MIRRFAAEMMILLVDYLRQASGLTSEHRIRKDAYWHILLFNTYIRILCNIERALGSGGSKKLVLET